MAVGRPYILEGFGYDIVNGIIDSLLILNDPCAKKVRSLQPCGNNFTLVG